MKQYKLLKDLPTFNAGDLFYIDEYDGCLYLDDENRAKDSHHWARRVMAYHKQTLEHFPNILRDWFVEIKAWRPTRLGEGYWYMTTCGVVLRGIWGDCAVDWDRYEFGNMFETEDEAEDAVEKVCKTFEKIRKIKLISE